MEHARKATESSGSSDSETSVASGEPGKTDIAVNEDDEKSLPRTKPASAKKRRPLELPDELMEPSELNPDNEQLLVTQRESGQWSLGGGGGQFEINTRGSLGDGFTGLEAPAPKRRSGGLAERSDRDRISEQNTAVIPSDVSMNLPSTGVALAGGMNAAGATEWPQITPSDSRSLPVIMPNNARNAAWPTNEGPVNDVNAANVPPAWPANRADRLADTAPANSIATPEPWPRAPDASGFARPNSNLFAAAPNGNEGPVAGGPTPAANVPPVNAEQPQRNNGAVPGFQVPPMSTQPPFATPANPQFPVAWPTGIPGAMAPFATSPDLDRLIVQTTAEVAAMIPGETEAERQAYLRKHVQLRLLHLIAGQMDRALQPVPGVDPADQEFWQKMLWGIANYFDTEGMPDSTERATQTIAQLQSAALRLQEKARLTLHNVAFCHKIISFGNSQRFKRDEFTPGQPVLLYAEVSNFKSEPTADGQFRTLMKSSIEVLEGGPQGRVVESIPFPPSGDHCRNHRRDYFHSYEFAIPQGISPGPHVLRLTVEDQLGKKTAVTTLNFTVQ